MYKSYSVLMSVYYKEKADNLRISIESMLDQTVPPEEFILVLDGPLTNELEKIVDDFYKENKDLFTIVRLEENRGLGPALAEGIKIARNELIARMDSDDYVVKDRCEKQLPFFDKDPELGIVGSNGVEFIGDISNVTGVHNVPEKNEQIYKFMKRRCAVIHPTVIYKKSAVLKSGNYKKLDLYEDYDLFSRMIFDKHIKAYNVQENLYYIRTSKDFFERRGGLKYALTALKFKFAMLKKGYMGIHDFIISGIGQFIICIIPNKLRTIFYNNFLRSEPIK